MHFSFFLLLFLSLFQLLFLERETREGGFHFVKKREGGKRERRENNAGSFLFHIFHFFVKRNTEKRTKKPFMFPPAVSLLFFTIDVPALAIYAQEGTQRREKSLFQKIEFSSLAEVAAAAVAPAASPPSSSGLFFLLLFVRQAQAREVVIRRRRRPLASPDRGGDQQLGVGGVDDCGGEGRRRRTRGACCCRRRRNTFFFLVSLSAAPHPPPSDPARGRKEKVEPLDVDRERAL